MATSDRVPSLWQFSNSPAKGLMASTCSTSAWLSASSSKGFPSSLQVSLVTPPSTSLMLKLQFLVGGANVSVLLTDGFAAELKSPMCQQRLDAQVPLHRLGPRSLELRVWLWLRVALLCLQAQPATAGQYSKPEVMQHCQLAALNLVCRSQQCSACVARLDATETPMQRTPSSSGEPLECR
eukprot:CAMPEP_0115734450 /NCGR_PEP_ID=MMETSP0272-20121206/86197_1 /TAXON_ID=71861 /ORGANISM="Scrippsiella trochoidea, Strain CCMP3099" /LENGTH=180 /DNA_ID=CAMNT_0003178499 /DNA_START=174 /DNA_END=712 /DNA_ORIENTATION=-